MTRLPKDTTYFDLFEALAEKAHRAALIFCDQYEETPKAYRTPREKAGSLFILEKEADADVHAVINLLNSHRDPPLKTGDDIHKLVHNMDNIVDMIEEAADRIMRYELAYHADFRALGAKLVKTTEQIRITMPLLRTISRDHEAIKEGCIAVNKYENDGDEAHRSALKELVMSVQNTFMQVRGKLEDLRAKKIIDVGTLMNIAESILQTIELLWQNLLAKEVLGLLERALDQCEDVADFLDALTKKNA